MRVVVKLRRAEGPGPEGHRVNITVISDDREYCGGCVVGSVRFDIDLSSRNPVVKYRGFRKCSLERVGPFPSDVGTREPRERNSDFRIVPDKTPIKITKPEKRLYVLDFARNGPIYNRRDFRRGHTEAVRRKNKTKIFGGRNTKLAFRKFAVKPGFPESPENFSDVFRVLSFIVRINQNVVKVNNDVDIQ